MSVIKRKLIIESPTYDLEFEHLQENTDAPKRLHISGRYIMLDEKNKNGRIYGSDEMIPALEIFQKDFIDTHRAGGELNHSDSIDMDLGKLSHKIISLQPEGAGSKYWSGKSKVLSTPNGRILENLVEDGMRFGMSSKCLGQLEESSAGNHVKSPIMIGVDAVYDPSVASAFVNGILESKEFIVEYADGKFEPAMENFEDKLKTLPKQDVVKEAVLRDAVIELIELLKN